MWGLAQTALDAVRIKSGVWGSGAGGFALGGIALIVSGQFAIGSVAIGLGLTMFLWGTTVYGRNLWEPWWRGPIRPDVKAVLLDFPYQQGTTVSGIPWDTAFSHVNLRIANLSTEMMSNLNFVIFLDRHIIKSVCQSPFAKCSIGPESVGIPTITVIGRDDHGNVVAIRGDRSNVIDIAPRHRLVCAELPHGAEIEVDLATVVALRPPSSRMWMKGLPTWINVVGTYTVRDMTQHVGWHLPLDPSRGVNPHDVSRDQLR